jgi:general stress protein 26
MAATTDREQGIEKLGKLIKGIRFAMLTTADADGSLKSRPMASQRTKFDGQLWFFTHQSSHKVDQVRRDWHVNVAYADPDDQTYVSVSGTAKLVTDKSKIKELWNPAYKAWFPSGVDDPDVALLRVDVDSAEYWDAPSSTMAHLYGMAKATVTGKPANVGDNRKVRIGRAGGTATDDWSSPAGEPIKRARATKTRQ